MTADEIKNESMLDRAIVSLKVSKQNADFASDQLCLAEPLCASNAEPQSFWIGPGQWLIVSKSRSANELIDLCDQKLVGVLHNSVDQSAAFKVIQVGGPTARALLASGSGLDFQDKKFTEGACCRTRLAQISAVIVATGEDQFEIYVDRGFQYYFINWLADTSTIAARVATSRLA